MDWSEDRRTSLALSIALLCSATADAAPTPDHCIVGEAVFGCRNEAEVAQITSYRGDAEALHQLIAENVSSGACEMFKVGEPVYVTSTASGADRAAVRRPGDAVSYWMPSSWSRPAAECSAYTSRRSLREKLGLAATSQSDAPEPDPAQTLLHQPSASPRYAAPGCTIKPVMTDAEIALCRNLNR